MEKGHIKQLLEIAKACRKAGITHYKDAMFEITLSDEAPAPMKPRGKSMTPKKEVSSGTQSELAAEDGFDSLTDEQKILYSSGSLLS